MRSRRRGLASTSSRLPAPPPPTRPCSRTRSSRRNTWQPGVILSLLKELLADDAPSGRHAHSLEWITDYLAAHIAESITVVDMDARAQLSQPRFASVFRERFGMPPHRYLLHLRVQHAQYLLTRTDPALTEIASCCGFADVHQFSKAFRRLCGVPPGGFRGRARA